MRLIRLVILLALGLPPQEAVSQVYSRPDSASMERAAAFASLTHWVETTHGVSEQSVMLRNNSQRPIQILSFEVHECVNIPNRVCKAKNPGPVVPPGKIIRLVTVSPRMAEEAWSFNYRFEAGYVPRPAPDSASH